MVSDVLNKDSNFFAASLLPATSKRCLRNLQAYWMALQNLSRPSEWSKGYLSCRSTWLCGPGSLQLRYWFMMSLIISKKGITAYAGRLEVCSAFLGINAVWTVSRIAIGSGLRVASRVTGKRIVRPLLASFAVIIFGWAMGASGWHLQVGVAWRFANTVWGATCKRLFPCLVLYFMQIDHRFPSRPVALVSSRRRTSLGCQSTQFGRSSALSYLHHRGVPVSAAVSAAGGDGIRWVVILIWGRRDIAAYWIEIHCARSSAYRIEKFST